MNLRKIMLATTAFIALSATSAQAEGISANVGFVTDYVFRGVSQTDEAAAVQGGFDYEDASGFHVGVWGSNVDFNNTLDGSLELDVYGGFAGEFEAISYDVGAIYYGYPGSDSSLDYDFWEVYLALGYQIDNVGLSAGVNYSPEFFGDTGDATYVYAGVDIELPHNFSASTHVGYQDIDESDDYTDWSVGLGYSWMDFDFGLTYTGTDLDANSLDDDRIVFGVSRSF